MLIPQHWAEARLVGEVAGKRRVVRRYGWSDDSPAHAERHADERARAALLRLQAGEHVAARDRKLAYGDERGLPIREEVVARRGHDVVTRNTYGARCLTNPTYCSPTSTSTSRRERGAACGSCSRPAR